MEENLLFYSFPLHGIFGVLCSWGGFVACLDAEVFFLLRICFLLACFFHGVLTDLP